MITSVILLLFYTLLEVSTKFGMESVNFIIAQDARRCIENAYPLPSALWDGKENPHSYTDIPNSWDRLRWCRYGLDLLQKEVAAMVGMEEWLYRDLESGTSHRSFTPELADKLATLYGIPVEDILDNYTLFLHRGGGDFLRRYREDLRF